MLVPFLSGPSAWCLSVMSQLCQNLDQLAKKFDMVGIKSYVYKNIFKLTSISKW